MGVLSKRQFKTEKNTVLDFDDMVLQDLAERVEALTTSKKFGVDDAVLREFDTERTGEMQEIVQTIHAAQYDLIALRWISSSISKVAPGPVRPWWLCIGSPGFCSTIRTPARR